MQRSSTCGKHRGSDRKGGAVERGFAGAAVEYPGEIRPRHPEAPGRLLHSHIAQVILQDLAGMGWIEKHA